MEIGASSACFYPLETEKAFLKTAERGFKNIEIFLNSPSETDKSFINELKSIRDYYGVNITSIHPYRSFSEGYELFSHYYRRYEDGCESYKKYFEAANILGAEYVVLHGAKYGAEISDEEYAKRFIGLNEIAMKEGCFLAHENVVNFSGETPDFLAMLKKNAGESFRSVLDVKQAKKASIDPLRFVEALGESICHVHLSDYNAVSDCVAPSEKGQFDFARLFSALEEKSYKGKYVIELYSDGFDTIEDIMDSARYLENILLAVRANK